LNQFRSFTKPVISLFAIAIIVVGLSGCGGSTTSQSDTSDNSSSTQTDTPDNSSSTQSDTSDNSSSTQTDTSDDSSTSAPSTVDEQNPLNLDDAGIARVRKILDDFGDDDSVLNALTNCISKYYEELNATFFDASQREIPMANVQDCTEELNPSVACRQADDGTGPMCGLANKRTGYSLAAVFGRMAG
jgi:hypothetical protein